MGISLLATLGPLGNIMLGKGMKTIGPVTGWAPAVLLHFFWRDFTSGPIWMGIGFLAVFFICYILVLSWADYSYIQPVSSISYAIVTLLATFVLHEVVTLLQWLGVAMICLGVFVVGRTSPRTTRNH